MQIFLLMNSCTVCVSVSGAVPKMTVKAPILSIINNSTSLRSANILSF